MVRWRSFSKPGFTVAQSRPPSTERMRPLPSTEASSTVRLPSVAPVNEATRPPTEAATAVTPHVTPRSRLVMNVPSPVKVYSIPSSDTISLPPPSSTRCQPSGLPPTRVVRHTPSLVPANSTSGPSAPEGGAP